MNQALIVLDNFYEEPEKIRKLALSLDYQEKEDATYPGKEAYISNSQWLDTWNYLKDKIEDDVTFSGQKKPPFLQGKFRIALAADELKRKDLVHEDVQKWSAVVYLSLPNHCKGGVAFYRHKKTGCTSASKEWIQDTFSEVLSERPHSLKDELRKHFKDESQWEKIGEIPMFYNRVVILMAHCFHGSTGVFGAQKDNGRLTQHFEFYSYDS